jgi:hypothetical protein
MENLGRTLMVGGVILLVAGAGVFILSKLGLPLGHLPGDFRIEGKNSVFFFPLTTCILLSLLLSGILALITHFWKK